MTNWHICEDPYPGPARTMTMAEAYELVKRAGRQYGKSFDLFKDAITGIDWEDYKKIYFESPWVNMEPIIKAKWEYGPDFDNNLMFRRNMTEEERREHALKCRKNRNTGPRDEWGFYRDGKRTR